MATICGHTMALWMGQTYYYPALMSVEFVSVSMSRIVAPLSVLGKLWPWCRYLLESSTLSCRRQKGIISPSFFLKTRVGGIFFWRLYFLAPAVDPLLVIWLSSVTRPIYSDGFGCSLVAVSFCQLAAPSWNGVFPFIELWLLTCNKHTFHYSK